MRPAKIRLDPRQPLESRRSPSYSCALHRAVILIRHYFDGAQVESCADPCAVSLTASPPPNIRPPPPIYATARRHSPPTGADSFPSRLSIRGFRRFSNVSEIHRNRASLGPIG